MIEAGCYNQTKLTFTLVTILQFTFIKPTHVVPNCSKASLMLKLIDGKNKLWNKFDHRRLEEAKVEF